MRQSQRFAGKKTPKRWITALLLMACMGCRHSAAPLQPYAEGLVRYVETGETVTASFNGFLVEEKLFNDIVSAAEGE